MKKFKYEQDTVTKYQDIAWKANKWGKEGWRLVSVNETQSLNGFILIFEKEIE